MAKEISFTIKVDDKGTLKKVTMDAEQLGRAVRSVQDDSEKAKRSVLTWAETAQAIDVLQNSIGELQGVVSDLTSAYQVQLVAETQIETIMRQRMAATDDAFDTMACTGKAKLQMLNNKFVDIFGKSVIVSLVGNDLPVAWTVDDMPYEIHSMYEAIAKYKDVVLVHVFMFSFEEPRCSGGVNRAFISFSSISFEN